MSALRLVLIIGNALLFAWTCYIFPGTHTTVHASDYVFAFSVLIFSGLNVVYLSLSLVRALAVPPSARHITSPQTQ